MKLCSECGERKPVAEFGLMRGRPRAACRRCHVARSRARRLEDPVRHEAHQRVAYALRTGQLERSTHCQRCGQAGQTQGHHDDYSRPLDVRWLCRSCHRQTHPGVRRSRAKPLQEREWFQRLAGFL